MSSHQREGKKAKAKARKKKSKGDVVSSTERLLAEMSGVPIAPPPVKPAVSIESVEESKPSEIDSSEETESIEKMLEDMAMVSPRLDSAMGVGPKEDAKSSSHRPSVAAEVGSSLSKEDAKSPSAIGAGAGAEPKKPDMRKLTSEIRSMLASSKDPHEVTKQMEALMELKKDEMKMMRVSGDGEHPVGGATPGVSRYGIIMFPNNESRDLENCEQVFLTSYVGMELRVETSTIPSRIIDDTENIIVYTCKKTKAPNPTEHKKPLPLGLDKEHSFGSIMLLRQIKGPVIITGSKHFSSERITEYGKNLSKIIATDRSMSKKIEQSRSLQKMVAAMMSESDTPRRTVRKVRA